MSVLFAATYPERVSAMVLYGSIARGAWAPDYPWGSKLDENHEEWLEGWRKEWGGPLPSKPGRRRQPMTRSSGSGGRNTCLWAQDRLTTRGSDFVQGPQIIAYNIRYKNG